MDTLYSLAMEQTHLTSVQANILIHMQSALQFSADISRNQVCICVQGKNPDMVVVMNSVRPSYSTEAMTFSSGEISLMEEFPLAGNVFLTGKKIVGRKELQIGRIVAVTAYPLFDSAGAIFGAVCFISSSLKQQQILTDTGYLALQVPLTDEPYRSLRVQDGMIVLDSVGRIIYANDIASDLCFVLDKETVEKEAVIGRVLIHMPLVEKVMETRRPAYGEEAAGELTLSAWCMPILFHGRVARVILIMTDVTAIREKERQILVKDSVIKEIHHRVKNNLNNIAGILRMQARRSQCAETKTVLRKTVSRILGISQIHDILARQSGENVDWDVLLDRLCHLSITNLTAARVTLVRGRDQKKILINAEKAVTLAIAVNELIHNAIEHGFADLEEGCLEAGWSREKDSLHVYIRNNGHLLPDTFSDQRYDLGLQIVRTLVETELGGRFRFSNEDGKVAAHVWCPLASMEVK